MKKILFGLTLIFLGSIVIGQTEATNKDGRKCDGSKFTWSDVTNPATGKTWMDRNLGASQVAKSSTDSLAYGDLYQWGRGSDGHQCRNSDTTSSLSNGDDPGHGDFITKSSEPFNWRETNNDSLWQGVDGVNNPCPDGYRIPTKTEWEEEVGTWTGQNAAGAIGSVLKLPMSGGRDTRDGSVGSDNYARYWSSFLYRNFQPFNMFFNRDFYYMGGVLKTDGASVRCIKD